jgi:hypothetical protein
MQNSTITFTGIRFSARRQKKNHGDDKNNKFHIQI